MPENSDLLNVTIGLAERLAALGYPPSDVTTEDVLADLDDYPAADQDAEVNYAVGLIHGYAMALGVTPLELLDEMFPGPDPEEKTC